jgi:hypothetical protein
LLFRFPSSRTRLEINGLTWWLYNCTVGVVLTRCWDRIAINELPFLTDSHFVVTLTELLLHFVRSWAHIRVASWNWSFRSAAKIYIRCFVFRDLVVYFIITRSWIIVRTYWLSFTANRHFLEIFAKFRLSLVSTWTDHRVSLHSISACLFSK